MRKSLVLFAVALVAGQFAAAAPAGAAAEAVAVDNVVGRAQEPAMLRVRRQGLVGSVIRGIADTVGSVGQQISNAVGAPVVGNAIRGVTNGVGDVAAAITSPITSLFGGFFGRLVPGSSSRGTVYSGSGQGLLSSSQANAISGSAGTIASARNPVAATSDLVGDVGQTIAGNLGFGLIGSAIRAVTNTVGNVSNAIRSGTGRM